MSSVSFLGALTGAASSSKAAAQRAASAGASFGMTLQGITDRANADAQAAKALADSSADKSSVHDAPKPDDSAADAASKSDDASDAQAASKPDRTDAPKEASKNTGKDASKPAASGTSSDATAAAAAQAKARADEANADDTDTDVTLSDLTNAITASADDDKSTGETHKSSDAKSAQDPLQAALAAINNPPVNPTTANAAANGSVASAREGAKGEDQGGLFGKGGKGAGLAVLASNVNADAKATDATALAVATMPADAATAAYKQAADAAAHAVAMQATSANSAVSSPQGAMASATSAAIAPHVGASGWDDAFSQKVVFLSKGDQQSAELTLNPKDLGPLQVTLQVSENHAHALFVSQHAQVREAVEAAMPKLREAMEANGISLGSASVSDGAAFGRQSQQESGGERSSGARGGRGVGGIGGGDDSVASSLSLPVRRRVGLVDTFA
ncbi:flagellar hook-length control protein [Caballeronia pedi]|uniref:Flagellar hook-length control protein n=1 Tax=Caballeronia pedi TaxID=1777141 RepID=A0A157ZY67_9BURK|nr:flagellar hook-length control protein FliK [Caballeronia pedi]SAK50498.1 flagellar hook-length control protein [Caballeronia pedi]